MTQRISDRGGNFTDIIHTIHGRIPEPDASITTEYIENENLGHRVAPGVFIGGTEQGLDVLNVSDLVASKGVALASLKLLVRNIGKVAARGIRVFEVGSYNTLKGVEVGLEAHHVGQRALMNRGKRRKLHGK